MSFIKNIQPSLQSFVILKQTEVPLQNKREEKPVSKQYSQLNSIVITKSFQVKQLSNVLLSGIYTIQQKARADIKKMIEHESSYSEKDVRKELEDINAKNKVAKDTIFKEVTKEANPFSELIALMIYGKIKNSALYINAEKEIKKCEMKKDIQKRIQEKVIAIKASAIEALSELKIPLSEQSKIKAKSSYDINKVVEEILKTKPENPLLQKADQAIKDFLEKSKELAHKIKEDFEAEKKRQSVTSPNLFIHRIVDVDFPY